jgi:hypothetical protein
MALNIPHVEVIAALLILLVAYYYFSTKEKYIEIPKVAESFDNIHVFNYENILKENE